MVGLGGIIWNHCLKYLLLCIELEYTERLCYYVHGVRIENTPLPCLPAQANRAGRKTNAAPKVSYESSVSPISMFRAYRAEQKSKTQQENSVLMLKTSDSRRQVSLVFLIWGISL